MKVRAILAFDIKEEDGKPVASVERYRVAPGGRAHAIRN
jgi:hypothetical protein